MKQNLACTHNSTFVIKQKMRLLKLNTLTGFVFLLPFLLTTTLTTKCQDNLKGKWYLFSRNRIVQLTITKDSLISQQLNWDLTNRDPDSKKEIQIINDQVSANGNIYLYLTKPQDTLKRISLNTIKIINPQKEIIIVINGTDTSFTDTSLIKQYISKDIDNKYGLPLVSESILNKHDPTNYKASGQPDLKPFLSMAALTALYT